jgi:poly-gamma-glutamate capsule biosynthesis protein CapA/YwtB (metallophosphatase superfamily)
VQTMEVYKGKYIFYSLGNFVFDQMFSLETRQGLAIKATFTRNGVRDVSFHPTLIEDYAQPHFLEGDEAAEVLLRLRLAE